MLGKKTVRGNIKVLITGDLLMIEKLTRTEHSLTTIQMTNVDIELLLKHTITRAL